MVIFSKCCLCDQIIKCRSPKDKFLVKMLAESKVSMCNECDPKSSWKVVKGIKGVI